MSDTYNAAKIEFVATGEDGSTYTLQVPEVVDGFTVDEKYRYGGELETFDEPQEFGFVNKPLQAIDLTITFRAVRKEGLDWIYRVLTSDGADRTPGQVEAIERAAQIAAIAQVRSLMDEEIAHAEANGHQLKHYEGPGAHVTAVAVVNARAVIEGAERRLGLIR